MTNANSTTSTSANSTAPRFWRDDTFPSIEGRSIQDGRKVCYAKHAHDTFSIGVITSGRTTYVNKTSRERIGPGTVVVMNPGDVHACNPIGDEPWAYRMMYVDRTWLATLQQEWGCGANTDFRPFSATMSTAKALYTGFNRFYDILTDEKTEPLHRQCAAVAFFEQVQQTLDAAPLAQREGNRRLERAAEFISDHCTQAVKLEDICNAANISPSYLIRAFKQHYGMTPHAYLLNRRIQRARALLRSGGAIADVAIATGFSDQAHFQRVFKQFIAATPGQYRG